jgi:hypothetical protein
MSASMSRQSCNDHIYRVVNEVPFIITENNQFDFKGLNMT